MQQPELMEEILAYWRKTDAFKQSIATRSTKMPFKFYDGPPFTSGDPHYGHLLQSTVKDMVPRWMTMRGYRVERKRGWDCHGIPAENFVNKELGITSRKQVEEEFGIKAYVEACRTMVSNVNDNRKWFVDHVGRRVDMENAYFTMSNEFMESVIAVFADLYQNNLIYKGFKVLGYSRALGTSLSNSEIAEGYEDRQDPAVTVKLKLTKPKGQPQPDFEVTEDGFIDCVCGVLKDEKGRFGMLFHADTQERLFPGGKIDKGESAVDALHRELFEEVGVEITHAKLLGHLKIVSHNKPWKIHYFEIEVNGIPHIKEPLKHTEWKRIEKVPADNELGFGVKIDQVVIDDVDQIMRKFTDQYLFTTGILQSLDAADAPMHLLAWTTTPWTLPANMFAAVHNDIDYVLVFDPAEKEYYLLAESLLKNYYKDAQSYILIYRLKGKELVGLPYEPLFNYYYRASTIDPTYHEQVHRVLHADFVTEEAGTGIAHEAPAFGEDDYALVSSILPKDTPKEWLFNPVNDHGEFTSEVTDFAGMNVIAANKEVLKHLKDRGLVAKLETITHSYPHCPRTGEPLIYRALESWFVKEDQLKAKTVPAVEEICFVPEAIKHRFIDTLLSAPDWNISRTRFRGAPLPVRECTTCDERVVCGSIAEIEQRSGQKVVDLHRPYIDDITFPCRCGKVMKRIPEVLDCRFESGSMPFGQDHWMKPPAKTESEEQLEEQDQESSKALGFDLSMVDAILHGQKTKTYRIGDKFRREYVVGDRVLLLSGPEKEQFGIAEITGVSSITFEQIPLITSGHEPFDSLQDKKIKFKRYYGMDIGDDELVTVIDFSLVEETKKISKPLPQGYEVVDSLPVSRRKEFKSIRLEAIEREPDAFGPMEKYAYEENQSDEDWQKRFVQGYSVFLLYKEEIVGVMRASPLRQDPTVGGIFSVYIRKEHRGKGLGKMLFDACVDRLTQQPGVQKLQVRVAKTQEAARAVYEKRGFVKVGEIDDNVYGTILHEHILELSLTQASSIQAFSPTADFIAEGLDQTRGWFRSLHVISTAYMNTIAFKNVAVTGMILAEDGKKMSKSKKNYPDPRHLLEKYGGDAFRLYLLSSPVVRAEPLRFSEKGVEQVLKDFVIPLQNVRNFFETYAKVDGWKANSTELYFMRHAEKDASEGEQESNIPLSQSGFAYLASDTFKEQIIRVRPDVVLYSPYLRCEQTVEGIKKVMETYTDQPVEYKADERLTIGNSHISYLLEELQSTGKRVLLVSHMVVFNPLREQYVGHLPPRIGYAEIVRLPATKVSNELDQRILAELHKTILEVDRALGGYEIEPATKAIIEFVDKLTNWYLRRSRRRFRSEGMDEDKASAYATLRNVLSTYLKIAGPFAPFTTEYLWQEMKQFQENPMHGSVHLEYRPLGSKAYIHQELIDEIATVRKIIKGAMYLRAKNKIKVKQPLRKLEVRI